MQATQILIVDDDPSGREALRLLLQKKGFLTMVAHDTIQAEQRISELSPDLILLDWKLPGMSGIEYARQLRKKPKTRPIPIIMLSAYNNEDARVEGLECGADDYVTKPYSIKELIARINLRLKKRCIPNAPHNGKSIEMEGICLEPAARKVIAKGVKLELDPLELNLLHFFILHPDQILSRQQLLTHVWGSDMHINERTVDVYIRRLRKTLKQGHCDSMLQTVRGAGYRFSTTD